MIEIQDSGGSQAPSFVFPEQSTYLVDLYRRAAEAATGMTDPQALAGFADRQFGMPFAMPYQPAQQMARNQWQYYKPFIKTALTNYPNLAKKIKPELFSIMGGQDPSMQALYGMFGMPADPGMQQLAAIMNFGQDPSLAMMHGLVGQNIGNIGSMNTLARLQAQGIDPSLDALKFFMNDPGTFNEGTTTLKSMSRGGINPYLERLVGAASGDVRRNLERNILPTIRSQGNAANPYGGGGSKEGIAEGLAARDATQQIADLASEMYGAAYDSDQARRLAAAQSIAVNALQGRAQQTQAAMGRGQLTDADQARMLQAAMGYTGNLLQDRQQRAAMTQAMNQMRNANLAQRAAAAQGYSQSAIAKQQQALQAAQAALGGRFQAAQMLPQTQSDMINALIGGATGLTNLGMAPYDAYWRQLLNYAQILNNPAVLGGSGTQQASGVGIL